MANQIISGQEIDMPEDMRAKSIVPMMQNTPGNTDESTVQSSTPTFPPAVTSEEPEQNPEGTTAPAYTKYVYKKSSGGKAPMNYQQLFNEISPSYKPLTPEQKEALRKRQRRDAVITAIGDGISALSNLYYTGRNALNAYDPKDSLSAKMQARRDQLMKDRAANEKWYVQNRMNAMKGDDANRRHDETLELEYQKAGAKENEREQKAERDVAKMKQDKDIADAKIKAEDERFAKKLKQDADLKAKDRALKASEGAAGRATQVAIANSRRKTGGKAGSGTYMELLIPGRDNPIIIDPERNKDANWSEVYWHTPDGRKISKSKRINVRLSTQQKVDAITRAIQAGDPAVINAARRFLGNENLSGEEKLYQRTPSATTPIKNKASGNTKEKTGNKAKKIVNW